MEVNGTPHYNTTSESSKSSVSSKSTTRACRTNGRFTLLNTANIAQWSSNQTDLNPIVLNTKKPRVLIIYTGGTFGMTYQMHPVLCIPTSSFLSEKIKAWTNSKAFVPTVFVEEWKETVDYFGHVSGRLDLQRVR
jgi:hypothetical protein